uniref:Peptidase C14 caspase domain-containing protein n=1 Tax=Hanusia phi TaxID=3032 RepID=A0A7S0EX88_9CRYP
MFSFVGHATEINGKLFLIPAGLKLKDTANLKSDDDLERHLRRHALLFDEVQAILRQVRRGQKPTVFVLDCCRSNGFYSTRAPAEDKMAAPSPDLINSCIIFSTQSGQVAFDGDPGRGGPFMSAFADSILLPNASLDDIMIETRKRVIQSTKEVQMAPVYNALTEKFIFNPVDGS